MRVPSKVMLALALLLMLGLLLVLLRLPGIRPAGEGKRTAAALRAPAQAAADSPLPTPAPIRPAEEVVIITPPPDGGVMVLESGKVYVFPSPTPMPTWTPRPTPTRRSRPTATPMPLSKPASSAAGLIYFTTSYIDNNQRAIHTQYSLAIDGQGEAVASPEAMGIPEWLDFAPYQIVVSPNQHYALYMQAVEPGVRPYVHNRINGETRSLFGDYSGGQFFGWHPDGRHFLFWIDEVGLWLVDAETFEVTMLAYPEGPVQGAAISPDGLTVAFIAEDLPTIGAMWFADTAGSNAIPQFDAGNTSFLYPTAWAPTNDRLLYHGDCPPSKSVPPTSGFFTMCIFHRQEQTFQPLNLPFAGYPSSWSPDGRYIVATGLDPNEQPCEKSETHNNPEKCLYRGRMIYLADSVTSEVYSLAPGIAPIWSPDGSSIAFLSDRTGSSEIWTIGSDGRDEQQLTAMGSYIMPRSLTWLREVQ